MEADNPAISPEELAAIRRRCDEATPGPWASWVEGRDHWGGDDIIQTAGEDIYPYGATVADKDFIAHARQDIPRLLAEIERLTALLSGR
ncbi:MAG: hypothetical protein KIS68_02740 [Bauldia sp.]|nr:hypothetical protein [Bauldia sp.]